MMSGTLAGTGSFRCEECGYVVNLAAADELPACPGCGGARFTRASLFAGARFQRKAGDAPTIEEREALIAEARERAREPGQYLAWADGDQVRIVALDREWTRVGRSLAADVRFDDPTVSRRHALIVRQADGVRVLDDRSLNGVFVNGERVEWRVLADGDEIVVGRYRLHFLEARPTWSRPAPRGWSPPARRELRARQARGGEDGGARARGIPGPLRPPVRFHATLARVAGVAQKIAVLSQKGGTGKTTAVRTLTDVFRAGGARRPRRRPRSAGQPVGLLRRRSRGDARRSATSSPGAPTPPRPSTTGSSPPT